MNRDDFRDEFRDRLQKIDWAGQDKRSAAVHEAGHIVVAAIRDGNFYGAYIEQNPTSEPVANRTWIGRSYGLNLAQAQSAAMSVAGHAAESLEDNSLITAAECVDFIELGEELSPTDRRGYPDNYERHRAQTASLPLRLGGHLALPTGPMRRHRSDDFRLIVGPVDSRVGGLFLRAQRTNLFLLRRFSPERANSG